MRGTSGRSRANRVTHKTKLHLLLGDFDVQPIVLGEEDEKEAQGLSTHGVDAEDANVSRRACPALIGSAFAAMAPPEQFAK